MKNLYRVLALLIALVFFLTAISCSKPVMDLDDLSDSESVSETVEAESGSNDDSDNVTDEEGDNTNNVTPDDNENENENENEGGEEPSPKPVTVTKTAPLVVISQNVRYKDEAVYGSIAQRAKRLSILIDEHAPDLIGLQEATHGKWIDPLKKLNMYGLVGCSRNGAEATDGEWSPILYRKDRFELLNSGTFWLTETPDVVGKVDGAGNNRICTWAYLLDKITGEKIMMVNTHLDHQNEDVRLVQVKHLLSHLNTILEANPSASVYFTGDFNCDRSSVTFAEVAKYYSDARTIAKQDVSDRSSTYNGFDKNNNKYEIDFCFYKGDDVVAEYDIVTDFYKAEGDSEAGFVSDHYAVKVTFELTYEASVVENNKEVKVLSQTLFYKDNDNNLGTVAQGIKRFKLLLNEQTPDLVGLQEASALWISSLKSLEGYGFVGASRDGIAEISGEWCPILYSTARYSYIDGGTFWLSATPDKVSKVDGASINRICTWAYLYDRENNERVIIASTHLDHTNDTVRLAEVKYINQYLGEITNSHPADSVYLTADLNCTIGSLPYNEIIKVFSDTRPADATGETFVATSGVKYVFDFCFYNGNDNLQSYEILTKKYKAEGDSAEMLVSDHNGILSVFAESESDGENSVITPAENEIVVLSQNVYCENNSPLGTIAQGTKRFELLVEESTPDLMGLQEATNEWVTAFKNLSNYGFVGVSRDGADKTTGEWCPILYSTARFTLLDSGTFWLTSTPDTVGVVSGASIKRICTWAYLYDKDPGKTILMANTHLDHQGDEAARVKQAEYLVSNLDLILKSRPADAVYLTGNINCGKNTTAYNKITEMLTDTRPADATENTYTSLSTGSSYLIDFCFYDGATTVEKYEILSKLYKAEGDSAEMKVSDHNAVKVTFKV